MRLAVEIPDALWRTAQRHEVDGGIDEMVKEGLRKRVYCAKAVEKAEANGVTGNLALRWAWGIAENEWEKKRIKA